MITLRLIIVMFIVFSSLVKADKPYSPDIIDDYPMDVYWGDTHLHTNLSADSYTLGNINLTPSDAYRFARGETITANNGQQAKLHKPLDFLIVADHAYNMGVYNALVAGDSALLMAETGKTLYEKVQKNQNQNWLF